ncbi:acyl-CoA dehydrogenase C-terminal domain-containing protein [Marinicellulosiphila megalodicopiae]|uniref:acyl-CoA dehydrogenase C-terminal domain-containing protein n=1 Tax=Marinicellulosiphila megalodicopiae TaxID=2724896 RepID=UPI003BB18F0A
MHQYKAPIEDIHFVLDSLDYSKHCQTIGATEASDDMVEAILEEAAKFCEQVLAPLYQVGDQEGCQFDNGVVTTPTGFKAAYEQWVENGWPSLAQKEEFGGQGMPESLGNVINELGGSANWAWAMYSGLSHGAMNTLEMHGTDEQKEEYLTPLVSGQWTGTMCLTEPHCGTDLGLLKTKATPQDDGSYSIEGTKIFISAGEHDLAENIVHIVIARMPDSPEGSKGISLFVVPKLLNGEANHVSCGSLEHKMGIHGNATCVMNFDGAKGFLIGPKNKGLNCMFTFMNFARLATAVQGLSTMELAYQGSLAYAKDRRAMRAMTGTKSPDQPADLIIEHADVRRMLLTQKAFAEGSRMLIYQLGMFVDIAKQEQDSPEKTRADEFLGLLTPIAKAFVTEAGFECANLGMQVFGGHGYIKEWGMEQIVRDSRISTLYEGTTGIQSLDLLGRKVLSNRGQVLKKYTKEMQSFCKQAKSIKEMKPFTNRLIKMSKEWGWMTLKIGLKARKNRDEVNAACVEYLMYSGYAVLAYMWAQMAYKAMQALEDPNCENKQQYINKIQTCEFYYERLLPRTRGFKDCLLGGSKTLMQMSADDF